MFEHLESDARRAIVRAADEEARGLGCATVEAEHLLLATAADGDTPVGRLLAANGLDHAGIVAALDHETAHSLAAVGVALDDFGGAAAVTAPRRKPRFAASAKRALARAMGVATGRGDRAVSTTHLVLGILAGERGTVARALEIAGVDRLALIGDAERLLA
jgi:ATP-dependent Clp protease ATP-binding subunit ClpA